MTKISGYDIDGQVLLVYEMYTNTMDKPVDYEYILIDNEKSI